MNRRTFLYAGAATAAAMSARSYGRIAGANDRVGIAVVGLGRRGTIVSSAFLEDNRAHIVTMQRRAPQLRTRNCSRAPMWMRCCSPSPITFT
jgi:hypothetical protein